MRRDQRSDEALSYRKLYKTARWKRTRARQLADHPLCQWCSKRGRITPATVCHHVDKDSKLDPATFFSGPFESLCSPCHDGNAQQIERIGFSAAIDESGWPTDPNHPANRR